MDKEYAMSAKGCHGGNGIYGRRRSRVWRCLMFRAIHSAFRSLGNLKKKLEYSVEKQVALTFYSEIALIFALDKQMVQLCRDMNSLIRTDDNYSNMEKCETVNNKIAARLNFLEHSRMAQKLVNAKKDIIERLEKHLGKYA